jgi:hypothetical protein
MVRTRHLKSFGGNKRTMSRKGGGKKRARGRSQSPCLTQFDKCLALREKYSMNLVEPYNLQLLATVAMNSPQFRKELLEKTFRGAQSRAMRTMRPVRAPSPSPETRRRGRKFRRTVQKSPRNSR